MLPAAAGMSFWHAARGRKGSRSGGGSRAVDNSVEKLCASCAQTQYMLF